MSSFLMMLSNIYDDVKIMFILSRKLYILFDRYNIIQSYTCKQLQKIVNLSKIIPLNNILCILQRVQIEKVTQFNVKDLYKFISNIDQFINGSVNIQWGPGNNRYPNINSIKHYKKHVDSSYEQHYLNEYQDWEQLGDKLSVDFNDCPMYINYAIDKFYQMSDVMVHTNGKGVYMSGFVMNVFIVGRYDKDTFGISSCYYVKSRKRMGRETDRVFDVTFDI